MEVIGHRKKLEVSKDDIGRNGYIKAANLFRMLEGISTEHAHLLNAGVEEMLRRNQIWVLSKLKYELYGPVRPGGEYYIETYPKPKKAVTYGRDYYIRDDRGEIIMAGASQWCILDFDTRKIVRRGVEFDGKFYDKDALDGTFEKIHEKSPEFVRMHTVTESDLDINQHVNNCRYVDMACEISGVDVFETFNIYFARESRTGDELHLFREEQQGSSVMTGKFEDGTVVFQAKGM